MIVRWLTPSLLLALLSAGVWLHDWRAIVGSLAAFVGVSLVEES